MVTAVELASDIAKLSPSRSSREAWVHQLVSVLDDEYQNFEVTTEPRLLSLGDCDIELQRLELSPPAQVHRLICAGLECTIFISRSTTTRIKS